MLPTGWRDRLVVVETPSTAPGRGYLLEPHDCVVSKLVAGREKDFEFAAALVHSGLITIGVLAARIETVDVAEPHRQRLRAWIAAAQHAALDAIQPVPASNDLDSTDIISELREERL